MSAALQPERDEQAVLSSVEPTHRDNHLPDAESECVIEVQQVRKKYCRDLKTSLAYGIRDVASALLPLRTKPDALRAQEFWAVDRVSFDLKRGESLGIIGHNGAGKSTLLKLITGQRSLTSGRVVTRGRIVALTELGLGFDPGLTGRENAYINAAILGLSRRDLAPILSKIIAFSELGDFIDSAVQTYSSGMKARLAFSVATNLDPDILIVDEVLAVGDLQFRRKCIEHVLGYVENGGSLLLVAHDPFMVQMMCKRVLVLEKGRVIFDGDTVEGVNLHFELGRAMQFERKTGQREAAQLDTGDGQTADRNWLSGIAASGKAPYLPGESLSPLTIDEPVIIDRIAVVPVEGEELTTTNPAIVKLYCRSSMSMPVGWGFSICTSDLLTNIASSVTGRDTQPPAEGKEDVPKYMMRAGENVFECLIPRLPLRPGVYAIRGGVGDAKSLAVIAARGFQNQPDFFSVKTGEPSRTLNFQMAMNDLVELQVEWLIGSAGR